MKDNVEKLILLLRQEGVSAEMCQMIKQNADAGAVEYAREILCGEVQENVEEVPE